MPTYTMDTLAKFGINLKDYSHDPNSVEEVEDKEAAIKRAGWGEDLEAWAEGPKVDQRIQDILNDIPDYSFMLEKRIVLPSDIFDVTA